MVDGRFQLALPQAKIRQVVACCEVVRVDSQGLAIYVGSADEVALCLQETGKIEMATGKRRVERQLMHSDQAIPKYS